MRLNLPVLLVLLMLGFYASLLFKQHHAPPLASGATSLTSNSTPETSSTKSKTFDAAPTNSETKLDFATQIKPIFEARCQPCHFSGGKVYSQMPFDRPETIKTLGTKLFTRIKDENERRMIRQFLEQN